MQFFDITEKTALQPFFCLQLCITALLQKLTCSKLYPPTFQAPQFIILVENPPLPATPKVGLFDGLSVGYEKKHTDDDYDHIEF